MSSAPHAGRRTGGAPRPVRRGRLLAPGVRVVGHLRRGNDVDVYDVVCETRRSRVVAKTPRPDLLDDPHVTRALAREARLLLGLTHPNIVRAYEYRREPRPVLLMETLGGETLSHALDMRPRLTLPDVCELGRQLVSALAYLHDRGVLHLDLKPSNVIAENGRARLIDLGIARRPGRVPAGLGTPGYLAPEQEAGGHVTAAADVFGLGMLLFEAATGDRPRVWRGGVAHASVPIRSARRVPRPLAEAIDGALDLQPAARPTLAELMPALGGERLASVA